MQRTVTPRQKPVYVDSGVPSDRPPFIPSHGHPLHGDEARQLARWILRWHRRKPYVPLSPSARRKLLHVVHGYEEQVPPRRKPFEPTVVHERPTLRAREFNAIVNYVRKRKEQIRQGQVATLRIQVGGGLLRLTR